MALLPPFPATADSEDFVRIDWNNQLRQQTISPTAWTSLDFTGSSLANLASRQHASLTSVLGTGAYHVSSAEAARITACITTQTKACIPTTSDIPAGMWAIYKDTSGGTIKLYANDGGTIKSVTLT